MMRCVQDHLLSFDNAKVSDIFKSTNIFGGKIENIFRNKTNNWRNSLQHSGKGDFEKKLRTAGVKRRRMGKASCPPFEIYAYIWVCDSKHLRQMSLTKIAITLIAAITAALSPLEAGAQKKQADEVASLVNIGQGVGGTRADFLKSAKQAGFGDAEIEEDDGLTLITLTGRLGSQRRCKLLSATNQDTGDKIHHASLFLPERSHWQDLKDDYDALKGCLTQAFGAPTESSESVADGVKADDAQMMKAVKADKVDYTAKFEKGDVTIMLSVTYSDEQGAHVGVLYIDRVLSDSIMELRK